jgi:hypothetical protein
MFAYYTRDDYFRDDNLEIFCVQIAGVRWSECPSLLHCIRIPATKKLVAMRKAKAMPSYYVHKLTLHRY